MASASVVAPLGRGPRARRSTLALEAHWTTGMRTKADARIPGSLITSLAWRRRDILGVPGLDISARVTNLTDEKGWAASSAEHVQDIIPARSRQILIGLGYRF